MQDFEKLGAFYLGKKYDTENHGITDDLTLYDAKDLTTHAVIIGMTGSGKTGLGISLIEEAALDHIPVIAIDPKGDLGNLLLTFPALEARDFEPWVDAGAALEAGQDAAQFAAATAARWQQGLADWGQDGDRIAKLRESAEFALYTPGSSAGRPVSVLKEFAAPAEANSDFLRDKIRSTVQNILTLLDIDADPLTSREHILLSNILSDVWSRGDSLDLPKLIGAIQSPGIARIGVMDLDAFYPPKERFGLAMRINNLLAAPGFDVWATGDPLDIDRLLFTTAGQPRVSVMSIAHLGDTERMFFVSALLNEIIDWMRKQSGSPSLRAILYMDEVFGYLPPVANPPTKQAFLTLLKQARAYGLGLVLATQNPVDLDYKGLSNTGTWFIGRLQTERDIDRVRDGLQSAAGSENLVPGKLDETLADIPKRCFLLHNVHDRVPVLFHTRWAMSYLAGPLTSEQIKTLNALAPRDQAAPPAPSAAAARAAPAELKLTRPVLDPSIEQYFVSPTLAARDGETAVYVPHLIASARVAYSRTRPSVSTSREYLLAAPAPDGPLGVDWDDALEIDVDNAELASRAAAGFMYAEIPPALSNPKSVARQQAKLKSWLRIERPLRIYKSETFKKYSEIAETERDFRIRLQSLGNEARDRKIASLRKRYERHVQTLQNRLLRAEQAVTREADQARGHKIDTALTFGTAILGALLGRKAVSVSSANRLGSAMRKAGRLGEQTADVRRAEETVESVKQQLAELEAEFDREVDSLDAVYDAQQDELTETEIRPRASDIEIGAFGIGWIPFYKESDGGLRCAIAD